MRILLVDDEPQLLGLVARTLRQEGYTVTTAGDGVEGHALAATGAFDVLVLDVMLPTMSGLEISFRLRRAGVQTPILMLTARDAVSDRVLGLDVGADDYLVKPFALEELIARLRALVRRRADPATAIKLEYGDLVLDRIRHEARRGERRVELTAREFAVLEHLMRRAGQVISREQLIAAVWPNDFQGGNNVVDTYIHYLREKIDSPPATPLIRTVRGVGYALTL